MGIRRRPWPTNTERRLRRATTALTGGKGAFRHGGPCGASPGAAAGRARVWPNPEADCQRRARSLAGAMRGLLTSPSQPNRWAKPMGATTKSKCCRQRSERPRPAAVGDSAPVLGSPVRVRPLQPPSAAACVGPARMARRTGGCPADARAAPGRADRHALRLRYRLSRAPRSGNSSGSCSDCNCPPDSSTRPYGKAPARSRRSKTCCWRRSSAPACCTSDETPWRESGQLLWLWVFNAVTTVVYFIGARSAEIFVNALQGGFGGCLMSDGYAVYRSYLNRIRCLAHPSCARPADWPRPLAGTRVRSGSNSST